jgi:RNA polymerase sigma-70 factor (ECF subfamily)
MWSGPSTDAELVSSARRGGADAVGALLERHRGELYAAALALLRDREAAQDAVQETSVIALTRLGALRDPDAVGSWLRAVLRNCCLMQIRRARHELPSAEPELGAGDDVEARIDRNALRDWIWSALDALPEEERTALVLRHFTRCRSYEAIAATTAVPVGTVRSRLNRARRRLVDSLAVAAGGRHHDQIGLETSRRREWEAFYRELQQVPEPRTYRDLYDRDVAVRDETGSWLGIDAWSAEEREAIELGVRATLGGLVAGRSLTVLELDFHNPPWAATHCPPSSTFVHRLRGGRTARLDIYYHRQAAPA